MPKSNVEDVHVLLLTSGGYFCGFLFQACLTLCQACSIDFFGILYALHNSTCVRHFPLKLLSFFPHLPGEGP
jgi:hypothetical protein